MTRPTKLDEKTQKNIIDAIRFGATYRSAAEAANITYETFNEWMKQGRAGQVPYSEFSDAVDKANAEARIILLARIQTASTPHDVTTVKRTQLPDGSKKEETTVTRDWDWRAAAWILERRFPDEYGQQLALHFNKMSDDELRAYIASRVGVLDSGDTRDVIEGRVGGDSPSDSGSGLPPQLDLGPSGGNGSTGT